MSAIGQSGVAVVAHFIAVRIGLVRTVDRVFHIAKLGFMISFIGISIDREGNLEHFVLFLPIDFRPECDGLGIFPQRDGLTAIRIADSLGDFQLYIAVYFAQPDLGPVIQRYRKLFIHAAQFPGVIAGVHILKEHKAVTLTGQVFHIAAGTLYADQMAVLVDTADNMAVRKHIAAFLFQIAATHAAFHRHIIIDIAGALGRDRHATANNIPAKGVVHRNLAALRIRFTQKLPHHGLAAFADIGQLRFRRFMDTLDGRAGGNIVELVKEQGFPQIIQPLPPVLRHFLACKQLPGQEILHLAQAVFRLADQTLGLGLAGQGATVPGQVQFAPEHIFYIPQPLKELHRMLHMAAGCAL